MHGQQLPETSASDPAESAALQLGVQSTLFESLRGARVEKPAEVAAYLQAHPDLATLVPEICRRAGTEFGGEAELVLKLYQDPEIEDRYLALYVRLPRYDSTITARLDRVTEPLDDALCNASGHFLVTTDFRAPGTSNGI
jgi:hypothetical protein